MERVNYCWYIVSLSMDSGVSYFWHFFRFWCFQILCFYSHYLTLYLLLPKQKCHTYSILIEHYLYYFFCINIPFIFLARWTLFGKITIMGVIVYLNMKYFMCIFKLGIFGIHVSKHPIWNDKLTNSYSVISDFGKSFLKRSREFSRKNTASLGDDICIRTYAFSISLVVRLLYRGHSFKSLL